ncbi:hypothetical protein ACJW31_06G058200 [Castanea mollissima]
MRRKEIEHKKKKKKKKKKETVTMASLTSCKPIFTASTIRNSKPKIQNQKHTNKGYITLIHIYIHTWPHTQKNCNTQTHDQTTINTHATQPRKRSQEVLTYDG